MKKLSILFVLLLFIMTICSDAWSSPERPLRIKTTYSSANEEQTTVEAVRSYTTREIRSIKDVVIVEDNHDIEVLFIVLPKRLSATRGGETMEGPKTVAISMIVMSGENDAFKFCHLDFVTEDHLRELCDRLVVELDNEVINDWFKKEAGK